MAATQSDQWQIASFIYSWTAQPAVDMGQILVNNWQFIALFLFALFSSIRSISVLVSTPSPATASPHPRVHTTRRRLLFLHGLNIAVRWGYGVWWLIAMDTAGVFKRTVWWWPLEYHLSIQDRASSFQALLLANALWILFDRGFSSDFWKSIVESSTIPRSGNESLIRTYHFADIFVRIQGFLLDSIAALALGSLLNKVSVVRGAFDTILPTSSGLNVDLLFFVSTYCLARTLLRLIGSGTSFGQFFSGTSIICNDGQPLSLGKILSREVYALICTAGIINPLVIVSGDENASIVDLISDTREIDVLAFMPHKDGSLCVSSTVPLRHSRIESSSTPATFLSPASSLKQRSPSNVSASVVRNSTKSPAVKTPAKSPARPAIKSTPSTTVTKTKNPSPAPSPVLVSVSKSTKKGIKRDAVDEDVDDESAPPLKSARKATKTVPTTEKKRGRPAKIKD